VRWVATSKHVALMAALRWFSRRCAAALLMADARGCVCVCVCVCVCDVCQWCRSCDAVAVERHYGRLFGGTPSWQTERSLTQLA
jgi:hypothetical protein